MYVIVDLSYHLAEFVAQIMRVISQMNHLSSVFVFHYTRYDI